MADATPFELLEAAVQDLLVAGPTSVEKLLGPLAGVTEFVGTFGHLAGRSP